MEEFVRFNIYEGIFWIGLGNTALILYFSLREKYHTLALFSFFVFILFGVSDFLEILVGGIFEPHQRWLLALKGASIISMTAATIWYIKLRIQK